MTIQKIHIIGSVASGKTTLAKRLSTIHNIPYYEIDNVVWKRTATGDIRRTETERKQVLQEIVQSQSWIIEGVHNEDWVLESFEKADMILFLKINLIVRDIRIIKRFIKQRLRLEASNYKPTYKIFFKMFKWNRYFEKQTPYILQRLKYYENKIHIINNQKDLEKLIKKIER